MKRSQLGALQDHNTRVSAFNEYEQSNFTTARQDRSIKAIRKSAEKIKHEWVWMPLELGRLVNRQDLLWQQTKHVWIEMQQDVLLEIKQCKIFLMLAQKCIRLHLQGLLTNGY